MKKLIFPFISILLIVSCASGKDNTYIGSTPADTSIRSFLGIRLSDSVDFIRWKIFIRKNRYQLQCNYGIAKANTNGFINGGVKIELEGDCRKEKNYCRFQNGNRILKALQINEDLIHLLSTGNYWLVGNAGWSYTLGSIKPSGTDQFDITAVPTAFKDSVAFEGRTPCNVPGVFAPGDLCYKLKWYIVLYANARMNAQGTFKAFGTPWRKDGGITGNWKIIKGKSGRLIYQLNYNNGKRFLYLLQPDEHILLFTDAEGKLLVGDEDFSYTLNKAL